MKEAARIYVEEIEQIRHLKGLVAGFNMQTIARDEIAQFQRKGRNAFGIREEDGPLTSRFFDDVSLLSPSIDISDVLGSKKIQRSTLTPKQYSTHLSTGAKRKTTSLS